MIVGSIFFLFLWPIGVESVSGSKMGEGRRRFRRASVQPDVIQTRKRRGYMRGISTFQLGL